MCKNLCLFEVMRSTLDTIIPTAVTSLCSKPNHIILQVIYCRKRGTAKRCLLSFAKNYGYFLCLVHISLNVGKNSKVRQLIKILFNIIQNQQTLFKLFYRQQAFGRLCYCCTHIAAQLKKINKNKILYFPSCTVAYILHD
jgi:hypothetical protein